VKSTTLRLSDAIHRLVSDEAQREGVTIARFCREAVIARTFLQAGLRGDAEDLTHVVALRKAFEQLNVDPEHGLEIVATTIATLMDGGLAEGLGA
jgi:hypothetical protein